MLYPVDSETREVRDLNGIWDFRLDADDQGVAAGWFQTPWTGPTFAMPVPASYNDLTTDAAVRDHVGPVWYRRTFFCPDAWRAKQVSLRFGAAAHAARVWLNGQALCAHQGGFLPFEAPAGSALKFGPEGENILIVRLDNRLDWTTLPPGEINEVRPGAGGETSRRQIYFHDFFNYAGLHRPVRLIVRPRGGIEDIQTRVTRAGVEARLAVQVSSLRPAFRATLLHAEGSVAAIAHGSTQAELSVAAPHWWSPAHPYLYSLRLELFDPAGQLVDVYRLPLGLRTIRVERDTFLLNEQPFYFTGFGRHEDSDLRGKGADAAVDQRDMNLLKWIGANSIRTSHYPCSEEFLRLADREGLAVIGECPAVGLFKFDEQENPTTPIFCAERAGEALRRHHLDTVRDMIARDRNHACVLMWSLGNEAATNEVSGVAHFTEVAQLARRLDGTRPLTIVECNYPRHSKIGHLVDVIAVNRYFGWYLDVGDLTAIAGRLSAELEEWRRRWPKPILLSEYGADTIAGLHKLPAVMFSEEFQVEYVKACNDVLDRHPYVVGEHVWAFADFATKQGITRIDGNRKGVFTRQRQPKAVAHYLRQRWQALTAKSPQLSTSQSPTSPQNATSAPIHNPGRTLEHLPSARG
jgi:beta-glucuronidase